MRRSLPLLVLAGCVSAPPPRPTTPWLDPPQGCIQELYRRGRKGRRVLLEVRKDGQVVGSERSVLPGLMLDDPPAYHLALRGRREERAAWLGVGLMAAGIAVNLAGIGVSAANDPGPMPRAGASGPPTYAFSIAGLGSLFLGGGLYVLLAGRAAADDQRAIEVYNRDAAERPEGCSGEAAPPQ